MNPRPLPIVPRAVAEAMRRDAERAASLALAGLVAPWLPAAVAGLDRRVREARAVSLLDQAPRLAA
jgi:hypothetical protein